jgi:hypothetical protein
MAQIKDLLDNRVEFQDSSTFGVVFEGHVSINGGTTNLVFCRACQINSMHGGRHLNIYLPYVEGSTMNTRDICSKRDWDRWMIQLLDSKLV